MALITPYHFKPYLVCKSETKLFLWFSFFPSSNFGWHSLRLEIRRGYGNNFWEQWTLELKREVTGGKGEQKERTESTWKDKENGGVELLGLSLGGGGLGLGV